MRSLHFLSRFDNIASKSLKRHALLPEILAGADFDQIQKTESNPLALCGIVRADHRRTLTVACNPPAGDQPKLRTFYESLGKAAESIPETSLTFSSSMLRRVSV